MLELIVSEHNTLGGGLSYDGFVLFDGKTVKEVLDEIRQYSTEHPANYLGDGFGNPSHKHDAWEIRINGVTYWSAWSGHSCQKYDHKLDNLIVKKIEVNGGWYCFYDFDIITK